MAIPQHVQDKVKRFDKELRLVERRGYDPAKRGEECMMIALERRGRDGAYRRIGWVRPDLLGDGSVLLNKLKASDLHEYGNSGDKAADAMDQDEREAKAKRKETRQDEFAQVAKAGWEHAKRRTGARINNVGLPQGA